jgi:hypothetical protein
MGSSLIFKVLSVTILASDRQSLRICGGLCAVASLESKRTPYFSPSAAMIRLASSSRALRTLSKHVLQSSSVHFPILMKAPLPYDANSLAVSRLGADPRLNRFHQPIVHHERYSFNGWPESHTFPVGTSYARSVCLSSRFDFANSLLSGTYVSPVSVARLTSHNRWTSSLASRMR